MTENPPATAETRSGSGPPALQRAAQSTSSLKKKAGREQAFVTRHGVETASSIKRQSEAISKIVAQEKKSRYLLHPEKNRYLGRWDMIASVALFYTALVTPFETAFLPGTLGPRAWIDPWYVINRVLDVIFFTDMVLQFFVAYPTGNSYGGFVWVEDHKLIAINYLKTWFVLDAGTVFLPGGFDIYLSTMDVTDAEAGSSAASSMSVLRVLRALRIVKLVRLVKASRLCTPPPLPPSRAVPCPLLRPALLARACVCVCGPRAVSSGADKRWQAKITLSCAHTRPKP